MEKKTEEKKKVEWPKLQKKVLDVLAGLKKLTIKDKLHASTFTRSLKVDLTSDELLEAGEELAKVLSQKVGLEDEITSIKADFKARITEVDALASQHINKISNKYQYKGVDCVEVMNNSTAKAYVLRTDTMAVITYRKLTADERQSKFNWSDGDFDGK